MASRATEGRFSALFASAASATGISLVLELGLRGVLDGVEQIPDPSLLLRRHPRQLGMAASQQLQRAAPPRDESGERCGGHALAALEQVVTHQPTQRR